MSATMEAIFRAFKLLVTKGSIERTDDTQGVQRVKGEITAGEVRTRMPRPLYHGLVSVPPVGSEAVFIPLNGDRRNLIVIGDNHPPTRLRNNEPGDTGFHSVDPDTKGPGSRVLCRGTRITSQPDEAASTRIEQNKTKVTIEHGSSSTILTVEDGKVTVDADGNKMVCNDADGEVSLENASGHKVRVTASNVSMEMQTGEKVEIGVGLLRMQLPGGDEINVTPGNMLLRGVNPLDFIRITGGNVAINGVTKVTITDPRGENVIP